MLNYNTQTLDKEELLLEESLTLSTIQQLQAEKTKLQGYSVQNLNYAKESTINLDENFLEDQEMYANAPELRKQFQDSIDSGRSSLVL